MLRRTGTDPTVGVSTTVESRDPNILASTSQQLPTKSSATKTELLVDDISSHSGTLPLTPSRSRSDEDTLSPGKSSIRPTNPHVRTYAGRSRSFLVAVPAAHSTPLAQDIVDDALLDNDATGDTQEDDFETGESYADLRLRWGVDNSEDELFPLVDESQSSQTDAKGKGTRNSKIAALTRVPSGMMNDLKSISELRSKGENRRFLDEMGYLFEGLESSGALGVRRGRYAYPFSLKLFHPSW